jgi:hypothetical protein
MRMIVLGLAAGIAALAAVPAAAGTPGDPFVGYPNVNPSTLPVSGGGFHVGVGGGSIHPGFDHRRFNGGGSLGVWVNGGQWAQYNNRAFAQDAYNDWWHDNPNRSQPSWVRNNQDCQRQWFAGDTLRC